MMKKFILLGFLFALVLSPILLFNQTDTLANADIHLTSEQLTINSDNKTLDECSGLTYFNDNLYISDNANKTIFRYNTSNASCTTAYLTSTLMETPNAIAISYNNNLLVAEKNLIGFYLEPQSESALSQTFDRYNDNGVIKNLPIIMKICSSGLNDIYLISQNKIFYYNGNQIKLLADLESLSFNENGGFTVTEDNSRLYFSISNVLYMINLTSIDFTNYEYQNTTVSTVNDLTLPILYNIYDLKTDHKNNLYILDNTSSGTVLHQVKNNIVNTVSLDGEFAGVNKFVFDSKNGNFYFGTQNKVIKATLTNDNQTLLPLLNQDTAPININNFTMSSTPYQVAYITIATHLYNYQSLQSYNFDLSIGKELLILDDMSASIYCYVLDNATQNITVGYILKSHCIKKESINPAFSIGKILLSNTKLYSLPTTQNINDTTTAPIISTLEYGQQVELITSPSIPTDYNGIYLVAIKYNYNNQNIVGYLNHQIVIDAQNIDLERTFVGNATTRSQTQVYSEPTLNNQIIILEKDTQIKVLSKHNGICKIEFVNGENTTYGYIKDIFLDDGTLTTTQILGLCLMAITLVLTIIILISLRLTINKRLRKK